MLAVVSDIHSNCEALTAVLTDIAGRDVEQIICLGDVIGYGPQPRECLDLVMQRAAVTLMGNHDYAVLYEPSKFNTGAEVACFWTRQQLDEESDPQRRGRYWEFLSSLPVKHTLVSPDPDINEMVFVHGSPRRPVNEYIFPDDIYSNPSKIQMIFDRFNHLCFVGHTHVPGVFLETPDFYGPDEVDGVYEIDPARKALINVGSVGQPRDRDPRACYVLVGQGQVRFVRVPYDVDAAVQKVLAVPELEDYLGHRLKEGR
jgi:diadenosine tetraphosphatase ApaH/serine/threonine PP2A family protein phosphatase